MAWLAAGSQEKGSGGTDVINGCSTSSEYPHKYGIEGSSNSQSSLGSCCYRLGSVGYDTHLCLWDLCDDVLGFLNIKDKSTTIAKKDNNTTIISIGSTTNTFGKIDVKFNIK